MTSLLWMALLYALPGVRGEDLELYETKVRPLLVERCHTCHGADKQRSGLRVDSRAALLLGGSRGPAIVPGDVEASLLVHAVRGTDAELAMPPRETLAADEIAALEEWIAAGAPAPDDSASGALEAFDLEARRANHWGFQPLARPTPPWPEGGADEIAHPVDAFVLAGLRREGLELAPEADRRTLLRRLSIDLIGLPPTPEELALFLDDGRVDAYEHQVDRLLASPHFGERWGRHWLDLVRYAETKGHEFDYAIPNAWQYRDYVIRAFDADVPYDRFVREHVAGDLLEPRPHPDEGWDEGILGTGFWFFGEEKHSPVDVLGDKLERAANQLDVFSKTFLGLTVACARCHDHKFEAVSTRDYYALAGYLQSASYRQVRFETREHNARVATELTELERLHRPAVYAATATALEAGLARTAEVMAAAREVERILGDESDVWPEWRTFVIEDVAGRREIAPARLEAWLAVSREARTREDHLLRPWGRAEGASELLQRGLQQASHMPTPRTIIDFAARPAAEWIQDGFAFRGVEGGEIRLGSDFANPLGRSFIAGGAASDPTWNRLGLARDTEREASRIDWVQSGRMLRTPTFRLENPKLYYLVDGAGQAFCQVDGHRMIAGPLHGATLRTWEDQGRRWIEHDLGDYVGHVVHVEFSPAADARGLVIERVVSGTRLPADERLGPPTDWLLATLASVDADDADALAEAYEGLFYHAAARLGEDRVAGRADAPDVVAILRWLLAHPPLLAQSLDTPAVRAALEPYLRERLTLLETLRLASHTAPALVDANGFDEELFFRGDPGQPRGAEPRRFLEALGGTPPTAGSSGRLELARLLTDPAQNPFMPRVWANRVWRHLLGRGLVATPDNLGTSGEGRTHAELLDHLATTLVDESHSTKRLIRHIVLSSTYRQGGLADPRALAIDPENALYHHHSLRRLEAEVLRDAMLTVAGNLEPERYGPPVPLHLTSFLAGRGRPARSGPIDGAGRRSVYLAVRRNFLSPFLQAFDFPLPATTRGARSRSNVPAQALSLWNDPFVIGQAERWAGTAIERWPDEALRLEGIYRQAFGRAPDEEEREAAREFIDACQTGDPTATWGELCHVLFNTKEFLFVD